MNYINKIKQLTYSLYTKIHKKKLILKILKFYGLFKITKITKKFYNFYNVYKKNHKKFLLLLNCQKLFKKRIKRLYTFYRQYIDASN
jgi:hypothetical protein